METQNQAQLSAINELEIQLMTDMYNKITDSCIKKCIVPKYREAELTKGEAVCLDRCTNKYFEVSDKIGKKLTDMTMQDVAKVQAAQELPKS